MSPLLSASQQTMRRPYICFALLLVALRINADDAQPRVITDFCRIHFPEGIAAKGEAFNATDAMERGQPFRRIVAYMVSSSTSLIWYEHGGRGYHQHLVRFNTVKPEEVVASSVFAKPPHTRIGELVSDAEYLNAHTSDGREL